MTRRVRFCGGARDGQYQEWDNDRPWPPEIATITSDPPLSARRLIEAIENPESDLRTFTQERYQRMGAQDVTGAELYASGEVMTALRRGTPLSSMGIIMPVTLAPLPHSARGAVLIGGAVHGRRMQVPYPMPAIRVPVVAEEYWRPDSELVVQVETVNYYSLDMRLANGDAVYVDTVLMTQIVSGTVREVSEWGNGMNALLASAARRYARMLDLLSPVLARVSEDVAHELAAIEDAARTLDDSLIYTHAYNTNAQMSGKKEYPLDAVAAENKRREEALRKATDCISAIDEVTDE